MAKTASRQATIFINGEEISNTLKGVRDAWKKVNNELALTVIGTEEYEAKMKDLQKLDGILTDHRAQLKGVKDGYSLLESGVGAFVGVAAGAFTVDAIIGYGKELFNTAVHLEAMEKKAKVVFGESLPSITREAEKNATAMGLTTHEYIAQAAGIQDLLVPMGFQRQEAANITAQLVNLSGALSEWSGGTVSAEQVSERLSAALLGERESLKELGIAISQADVDARLAAQGLDKLGGASREQAEAAATLQLILEKSSDAQKAYGDNSESNIRRQAELSAKFSEISEKLAVALIPVFERLVSVADGIADVFLGIATAVGDAADPIGAATKAFDTQAGKVNDLEKNMAPLLDRYDELAGKGSLNKKEQAELNTIIATVTETVPSAATAFDDYGRALGLNTEQARQFIEVEKKRLQFVNSESIKTVEEETKVLEQLAVVQKRILDTRQKLVVGIGNVNVTENELTTASAALSDLQNKIAGAKSEIARLKGENIPGATSPETPTGGGGGGKELSDKAKKEAEKIQNDLTNLLEKQLQLRQDLLEQGAKDELQKAVLAIERKYDAEIEKAEELERKNVKRATELKIQLETEKEQAITLEIRRQAEIARAEFEKKEQERKFADAQKEAAEFAATEQFKTERENAKKQAEEQLKQFEEAGKIQDQASEIAQLDAHYTQLLLLADEFGLSDVQLAAAYAAQKAKINRDYAEKQKATSSELTQAELDLQAIKISAMQEGASLIGGLFEQNSAIANAFFVFEKLAAIAALVVNFQKERSLIALNAEQTASASGPAASVIAPAIAAARIAQARVRLGLGIASIASTSLGKFISPKAKQKFRGGLLPVTGETDGQAYLAAAMSAPNTGLLPHYPVLFPSAATGQPILASERGAEYFIAAHDLRKPAVANLVGMIDALTQTSRARQFADGGANVPATAAQPPAMTDALLRQLNGTLSTLATILSSGKVVAIVPDQTVVDINDRLKTLNAVSGGYYN